ncbi:riboflavin kinase [Candidatus Saccharibacteria bacterium]|jgi:riboflavin kinase/FMN adenylyltransferase|nr:riboflavin kinase [Candidatus Saccharibacteria bacterium]
MHSNSWHKGTVLHGDKIGRTLGFPSANLSAELVPKGTTPGVYHARVRIGSSHFSGVLYFGPRFSEGESHNSLEIHILDFNDDLYAQTIEFQLGAFIRPPLPFASTKEVISQLTKDVTAIRAFYLSDQSQNDLSHTSK